MASLSSFESVWARVHILIISGLNFFVAVVLFVYRNWRTRGPLLTYVHNDPSTFSLVVQFLSATLSASNIYSLSLSINLTQRLRLTRNWTSFNNFIFWALLTAGLLDFALPIVSSLLLCVRFGFRFALAPLWAAAIAPALTDKSCSISTLGVNYTSSSRHVWDSQFQFKDNLVWNYFQNCQTVWKDESPFSNCPVPQLNGFLLRAAEASAATTRPVPKFDTSGYTFKGRSFGAGSGIGMTPGMNLSDLDRTGVQQFSFIETGYEASVKCTKNSSSDLYFIQDVPQSEGNPNIYHLQGYLPNSFDGSDVERYSITTWTSPFENMTAWSALHNPYNNANIVSVAAGTEKYAVLNGTQCDIRFEPRNMHVQVNVTSRLFIVDPLKDAAQVIDPEPTGNLTAAVVRSLNLLSRMTSHLYVSEVGEVLLSSLEGLTVMNHSTGSTEDPVLDSTSKFFTSLIDNILSAYAMSQIYISNDTHVIDIPDARCEAARLGSEIYIAIVLAFNKGIFCYILGDFLMHRGWRLVPAWDVRSVKDLIAACTGRNASHSVSEKGIEKVLLMQVAHKENNPLSKDDELKWLLQVATESDTEHLLQTNKG